MPDMTMCTGANVYGDLCERRSSCKRHISKPASVYQSWFLDAPLDVSSKGQQSCGFYMEITDVQPKV